MKANRGARGKAAAKIVTKPYWMTVCVCVCVRVGRVVTEGERQKESQRMSHTHAHARTHTHTHTHTQAYICTHVHKTNLGLITMWFVHFLAVMSKQHM